jgi:hypothetical protein
VNRDPGLEKAWRAHSRESPPPALDQAILAAAHRAVASGPRKLVPEATRPPRWWMPLAAAATIGAVAIGVIQLSPPEPQFDTSPTAPSPAQRYAEEKPATPAATPPPPPPAAPKIEPPSGRLPADAKPASPTPSFPQPRAEEKRAAAKESASAMPEQEQAKKQKAASDRPQAPAKVAEGKANKLEAQPPEPFPDAGRKTDAMTDKRAVESPRDNAGFVADAVTPGARSAPAPVAPPPQRADANKDALRERSLAAAAPAKGPPPPAAPSPQRQAFVPRELDVDTAGSGRMAAAPRAQSEPQAAGAISQLGKNVEASEEARQKASDPDAWIARIRKLRDEGKTADAQRELREFRALVPDAERRLPADLRDWKP